MAATDSLEEIQSMRECLNQLPSIKDNQQLVATTSTIVTKLRSFNDALPQRDVLQRLSLQVQPSLVDVVSISEEIAGGNDENRWKLDEATRRLSANLCDVESVLVEEMRDDRSAEETLTHYRAKLEERRERMGKSVVGEKLESTLESSREELSHGVDHLEKALAHPSPNRDDVTRPAAVVAKAVCSLLDVADTYFQTPLVYRSELYGHTMSVIRIAKNYILDVEEMKTAVSRLTVSVQSIREQCQNQMGRSASLQIEVESLKQDDASSDGSGRCVTDSNETSLRQSPIILTAKALYDFDMEDKEENLQFFKGDIIQVTKRNEGGWWEGRSGVKTGVFPASFVQVIGEQPTQSPSHSATKLTPNLSLAALRTGQPTSSDQEDVGSLSERRSSTGNGKLRVQHQSPSASDSGQLPAYATSRRVYTWSGDDGGQLTQPVHKEGIMKKEGGHHKSWKTRWFILDHEKISYYRPTQLKSPMGSIGLRDYKFAAVTGDRPGHQNCFNLVSSGDKRIYYFSTSSRAEMNDWILHINRAIKKRKISSAGQIGDESAHAEFEGSMGKVAAAECIEYLLVEDRIGHEGLFRINGNVGQVKRYLQAVDQGTVPPVEEIHNPHTVASILKHLIKEHKVKVLVVSSIARELYQEVEKNCAPMAARSLLFGVHGFRLLGGLIRLFSEVLAVQKSGKRSVTVDDLARAFGVYVFEDLNVQEAVVVLQYLLSVQGEVFG
ncbi:uncharacterized protein LOC134189425 [Corticium candelabrum]|uniref:uncharacterized protein LOC134189425 n=1 Tax=Corticium candelabrum TaxID=121492 RepID=UPI002E27491A|nr:uncharacterized protein LOC134189425 [Corticium candelabrum]